MNLRDIINQTATTWKDVLLAYPHLNDIEAFLANEQAVYGDEVPTYPAPENIFHCFQYFNPEETNVVILGQDPYHGEGQATGLCFAVNEHVKIPPSLRNIKNHLDLDQGVQLTDTTLRGWAQQGVLLLNSALTVRKGNPSSHMTVWLPFTKYIIDYLNRMQTGIVFVAWGSFAYDKLKDIDEKKHGLIVSSHPSPFSAYRNLKTFPPFLSSYPFTKINEFCALRGAGKVIDFGCHK